MIIDFDMVFFYFKFLNNYEINITLQWEIAVYATDFQKLSHMY